MKHFRRCLIIASAIFLSTALHAQGLGKGEKIKDVNLPQMINYKKSRASLSEFNAQPLLITFWNTHCSEGVEFLPRLAAMQKQLKNKFNVLVVAYENQQTVERAFKEKKLLTGIHLPVMVEDSVLKVNFPHRSEPHMVWIDRHGIVQAITADDLVNEKNLSLFINGQKLNLPLKKESMDPNIYYSLTPLMVNDYENTKAKLLCNSYLGGYREGIMSGFTVARYDKEENVVRIQAQNNSPLRLYKLAYKKFTDFHDTRIILEDNNDSYKELLRERFCYDLILKDTSPQKAYAFMIQDLDRHFGLKSSLEKRKIKVLVLKRTSLVDKLKSKSNNPPDSYAINGRFIAHGIKLETWLRNLNANSEFSLQLVNETGYKERIDLEITADFKNISSVRNSISVYDLDLVEEEREMEVIVLTINPK